RVLSAWGLELAFRHCSMVTPSGRSLGSFQYQSGSPVPFVLKKSLLKFSYSFASNGPNLSLLFELTPVFAEKLITGFPDFPRFVVTITTPEAALAPKTAAELASLSTSMLSISLGLISARLPL